MALLAAPAKTGARLMGLSQIWRGDPVTTLAGVIIVAIMIVGSAVKMARSIFPDPVQNWLKHAVYCRNCHLDPSRYRAELSRWCWLLGSGRCDLAQPRTMIDKINWMKLYDSTPLKGRLADKYLVREWVAQRIGREYLVPLLGVWDCPGQIDFYALPDQFVLKVTHGSGWNIIVPDRSRLDVADARRRLAEWLTRRQAMKGGFEMHYEYCRPRIVCEQYLQDGTGGLRDYKFMVFDGVVQFAFTVDRLPGGTFRGTYLPDWTRAPFEYTCQAKRAQDVPAPRRLEEMLAISQELGKGFACVRVDLHEVDGRVLFGEMTFTDADGLAKFLPPSYDREFGDRIVLPDKKPFKGVML